MKRFGDNGEKFHLSMLQGYSSYCGLATKFTHMLGLVPAFRSVPMWFGSTMHEAISQIHESNLLDADDTALYELIKNCMRYAEFESDYLTTNGVHDYEIPINWPEDEGDKQDLKDAYANDALVMLRNYCKDPMNRECEVLLNEAPFKLALKTDKTGYLFEGKIDQLRKYPDGTLDLTDFKTGKGAIPSDVQLRRDIQLNGYSLAIQDGFFTVDGISQYIGQLPDTITYHNLRDYMEYKKPTPIALLEDRGNNLTSSYREWFTNTAQTYTMDEIRELTGNNRLSAKTKVYFNTGHCKGPARHTVPITEHSVEVIKKQIQRYCAQIRFDFWPMDDRACNSCRHVDACDIYLDGTDKNFVAEDDFLPEEYYQLN